MFEKLKALLAKYNITIGTEKENEIKAEIEKLEPGQSIDWSKVDLSKVGSEMKPFLETLTNQNKILSEQVKSLTDSLVAEKTARENSIKAQADEAKKAQDKKVDDAVNKLFADKKITEAEKAQWKTDYETNFDMADRMASKLTVLKQFQGKEAGSQKTEVGSQKVEGEQKVSPHKALAEAIRDQMGTGDNKV